MAYLLDANILLRYAQQTDAQHGLIVDAVDELLNRGETLHAGPQNLVEAYAVATRPVAGNGYGMTPQDAELMIQKLLAAFPLLPDHPDTFPLWLEQVQQFGVSGLQTHDCRIVAFMRAHGVTNLLTLNGKDFQRYAPLGIVVVAPADVVQP